MTAPLSALEILAKLVSFPTVSRDSNLPLIEWLEGYLQSQGIETHRYTDPEQPKAALFAHVGPMEEGAVVLSGHTEVVPVDGQAWTSDPFELVERDGRLIGRGTTDMKGFDALAIWALVEAHRRGVTRPLQLALSFDEEIGCTGAPPLIAAMAEVVPKGSAVIVGEPSSLRPVTAHKGGYRFDTHVHGFEVHSSLVDRGVSAIMYGAKLIDWANQVNIEGQAGAKTPVAALFDPPYTTAHVGMIAGGTANNITAKDCRFPMEFRVVPGETGAEWEARFRAKAAEVEAQMQAVVAATRIEISAHFGVPGLEPETDGEAEALVRRVTGDNAEHVVSYGTEAGHFQAAGYSAVVCGPGDIAQAHQPDEFITRADFEAGQRFMEKLLETCGA